jgi:diguanylate cyclase (GGDEF)-like protein/PAS domain S-box-containing protein
MGLTTATVVDPPSTKAASSRNGRAIAWLTVVLAMLAALATSLAEQVASPREPIAFGVLLLVLVALVVGGLVNLEYQYRGQIDAFDHFEVALVPALYYLRPLQVVALAAGAKLISQAYRRVAPTKVVFNVVQWAAATGVGALVFGALATEKSTERDLLFVSAAIIAVMLVNTVAYLAVLGALHAGQIRLPQGAPALLIGTAGPGLVNLSFGVLFVATVTEAPEASVLLLVPLALLHWASRGFAVARVERTRLSTMRLATAALSDVSDLPTAIGRFLGAVGNGLDREAVDLVIVVDGLVVHSWRRDGGMAVEVIDRGAAPPIVGHLLELRRPIRANVIRGDETLRTLLADAGWRDVAAAPLEGVPEITGVLVLHNSRGPVAFPDRDLAVVAELAREVGMALERDRLLRAVFDERAKMSQIVNEIRDGIVTLGPDGTVHSWNPALERITGYAAADMVDRAKLDVLRPVDSSRRRISFDDWLDAVEDPPPDVLIRTKSGNPRWLSCSYARTTDATEPAHRMIVMARDVTELKYAEGRLAGQTAVLELIASGEPVHSSLQALAEDLAKIDEDVSCAVLLTSSADPAQLDVVSLAGVRMGVLADLDALRVSPDAGWPGRAVYLRRSIFIEDVRTADPDDERSAKLRAAAELHGIRACAAVPIRAPDGDRVIGVLALFSGRPRSQGEARDRGLLERTAHLAAVAVARSEFESRLAFQATHDALTRLPNRAVSLDRTEHALHNCPPDAMTVMLFLDLDRFKLINDSMGHEGGDQLLVEIADRLRRAVRPEDLVARFGGDEFTILCERINSTAFVYEFAARIKDVFARPVVLGGNEVVVTASIGIAIGDRNTEADELVNQADAAMYRAKERGGNRHEMYDPSMRGPGMLHLLTHNALHRALDRGELVVLYQPIVSLGSGQMIAVEALLRWNHPERGMLLPDAFLPLAESTGLIVPIGAHVVATACRQAGLWSKAGPGGGPLRVNINLSARELGQPELPHAIAQVLQGSGADPSSICFEITESALLYDIDATESTLQQLKALGVQLSIDDFGTGYSGLTHLRRFPVDGLKVDRSFVAGLDDQSGDRAIVSAVLGLANSLQLSSTAEGVETQRQLAILEQLGCESAQGFFLAFPGSPDEILAAGGPPSLRTVARPTSNGHAVNGPNANGHGSNGHGPA